MAAPETIEYSETTNAASFGDETREQLRKAVFKFVIKGIGTRTNKYTSDLELNLTLAPLDANDNPHTPVGYYSLPVPVPNPDVAGHKFKDDGDGDKKFKGAKRKKILKFAEAIGEDLKFEVLPRKNDSTGEFTKPDGSVMTREDWDLYNNERNAKAKELVKGWYNDRQKLVGETVFGGVGGANPQYSKIIWVGATPGDKPVETSDFELVPEVV